jgi:hypothetical protein
MSEGAVVILAGGTGGAKLARGMLDVVNPEQLTVIANTADDIELYARVQCPAPTWAVANPPASYAPDSSAAAVIFDSFGRAGGQWSAASTIASARRDKPDTPRASSMAARHVVLPLDHYVRPRRGNLEASRCRRGRVVDHHETVCSRHHRMRMARLSSNPIIATVIPRPVASMRVRRSANRAARSPCPATVRCPGQRASRGWSIGARQPPTTRAWLTSAESPSRRAYEPQCRVLEIPTRTSVSGVRVTACAVRWAVKGTRLASSRHSRPLHVSGPPLSLRAPKPASGRRTQSPDSGAAQRDRLSCPMLKPLVSSA